MSDEDETRLRYFHHQHKPGRDVGIKNQQKKEKGEIVNTLNLSTANTDTVVIEYWRVNTLTTLRLLMVNHLKISKSFFNEYRSISRLEIGCPISVTWLFQNVSNFASLKTIRFGRQVCFEYPNEEVSTDVEFDVNSSVSAMEVEYDSRVYLGLTSEKKSQVDLNFIQVIQLSRKVFPGLEECTIQVPKSVENHLDEFVKSFRKFLEKGQKRCKPAEEHVYFICTAISIEKAKQRLKEPRVVKPKQVCKKKSAAKSDPEPSTSKGNVRPVQVIRIKREVERRNDTSFQDNEPTSSGIHCETIESD